MLNKLEGPLGGLLIVIITALVFYGLVYFIACAAIYRHMDRKFYTPTCEMLIEQGWEIDLDECIERFSSV